MINCNSLICIPTKNAGKEFVNSLKAIRDQDFQVDQILVIDSGSTDETVDLAREAGTLIYSIPSREFNHGSTRNLALSLSDAEFFIYLTQDAIPADKFTIKNLITPFIKYPEVGLVYGRQLPRPGAGALESFSRYFSYPPFPALKKKKDVIIQGIRTVRCSNSCAAYRRSALTQIGGFPDNVIMCEDMYVAAKMLQADIAVYYAADALVFHSHNYSFKQEFNRYFDLGVFLEAKERWIIEDFGKITGEGFRFASKGASFFINNKQHYLIIKLLIQSLARLIGYKLGSKEAYLPNYIKQYLSMNKKYWEQQNIDN